jgi:hypothetical protein
MEPAVFIKSEQALERFTLPPARPSEPEMLTPDDIEQERVKLEPEDFLRPLSFETGEFIEPSWPCEEIVVSQKDLKRVLKDLGKRAILSFDNETSMTEEQRAAVEEAEARGIKMKGDLSAKLCLIQVGYPNHRRLKSKGPDGEVVEKIKIYPDKPGKNYLISAVKLREEEQERAKQDGDRVTNFLDPFRELLEDGNQSLIIQNATFEREQFYRYEIFLNAIQDTIPLAKAFRPDLPAYNLGALALEISDILLDKENQKSAWDDWPLSEGQQKYARLDTEVAFKVWADIMSYHVRAEEDLQPILKRESMDEYLQTVQRLEWDRRMLLENAGLLEEDRTLRATIEKYETHLKKDILPKELERLQGEKESPIDEGVGYFYKGPFGSAYYRRKITRQLDRELLNEIDPDLESEVQKPKCTKKAIEAAVAELSKSGDWDGDGAAKIWETITKGSGRTKPGLKLTLAEVPDEVDMKALVEEIAVPKDASVSDMLKEITELKLTRARLLRLAGIGNELAFIELKKRIMGDEILAKLIEDNRDEDGEMAPKAAHEGTHGVALYSTRALPRVNFELFQESYEQIYDASVSHEISRTAVEDALYERGYDPKMREDLMAKLYTRTGELGNFEARIYPATSRYYKGVEEEYELDEKTAFNTDLTQDEAEDEFTGEE